MQWECLAGYGNTLSTAMKAFPTDSYADAENGAPHIQYSIVAKQGAGDLMKRKFHRQPSNPVTTEEPIAVCSVR